MNIALAVAVITVMAVTIYLNITLNHHIADTNMEIEHLKYMSERIRKLDESIDNDLDLAEMKINLDRVKLNVHQESIDEITARLEEIAKDIKRLDERTEADHKNLVDIRERYVLFRTPINPAENGGVEWAKDIKCKDDEND